MLIWDYSTVKTRYPVCCYYGCHRMERAPLAFSLGSHVVSLQDEWGSVGSDSPNIKLADTIFQYLQLIIASVFSHNHLSYSSVVTETHYAVYIRGSTAKRLRFAKKTEGSHQNSTETLFPSPLFVSRSTPLMYFLDRHGMMKDWNLMDPWRSFHWTIS